MSEIIINMMEDTRSFFNNKNLFIPIDEFTNDIDATKLCLNVLISVLVMTLFYILIWLNINLKTNEVVKKCNKFKIKRKNNRIDILKNNDTDGLIAKYFML